MKEIKAAGKEQNVQCKGRRIKGKERIKRNKKKERSRRKTREKKD